MAGRMAGKVSFITGAGRGQGRAHAVLQAREGADIIGIDICEDIKSNPYPLAGWDDLMETKKLVEKEGRRCVAVKADNATPPAPSTPSTSSSFIRKPFPYSPFPVGGALPISR
jgi:NAD(P)-dependent dehydrogenase (short-subunit alcohol dehydrogenase family)